MSPWDGMVCYCPRCGTYLYGWRLPGFLCESCRRAYMPTPDGMKERSEYLEKHRRAESDVRRDQ